MNKNITATKQNYQRRLMYMPGNTALKKSKYEIEVDYNPITNGTVAKNSHLCAISVRSMQEKPIAPRIIKKSKVNRDFDDLSSQKKQSTYQEQYSQSSRVTIKKSKQMSETRPNTAIIKPKFLKKQEKYEKLQLPIESQKAFNVLQKQIQSLKDAQNIQQKKFATCEVETEDPIDVIEDQNQECQLEQSEDEKYTEQFSNVTSSSKIEELLKQHPDYYNHLSGQCKCFTCSCLQNCQCNFKKMLIKFIPSYKSVYNFSFQNQIQESKIHQNEQHHKLVQNCLKTDLVNHCATTQAQGKTIAGYDYNNHGPQQKTQNLKPQTMVKSFSSQNLTHYKFNFNNNPTYQNIQYKDMSLQPILSPEPIQRNSQYQENFKQREKAQDIQIINNALIKRSPYSELVQFGYNTQNRQTYQGQQVYDKTNMIKKTDHLTTLDGFKKFLRSTSQDYGSIQTFKCD